MGNGTDLYGFDVLPAGSTTIIGGSDFQAAVARLATSDVNATTGNRKVASFTNKGELRFEDLNLKLGLNIRSIKE